MALFNVTNGRINESQEGRLRTFRTSNVNIAVSVREKLRMSELEITEQEWLGNFN